MLLSLSGYTVLLAKRWAMHCTLFYNFTCFLYIWWSVSADLLPAVYVHQSYLIFANLSVGVAVYFSKHDSFCAANLLVTCHRINVWHVIPY